MKSLSNIYQFKKGRQLARKFNFSRWFSSTTILIIFLVESLFAAKTDILILQNGDRTTGEIKELKFGKLKYGTDDAGTIIFEWDKIAYLETVNQYQVETEDGNIYYGALDTDTVANKLLVISAADSFVTDFPEVVWIILVKKKFWSRLGASLSLGSSYTKASDVGQLSFSGNANYRTPKHYLDLNLSTIFTSQPEKETTKNADYILGYSRVLKHHWTFGGETGFQQNTELGLDLRYLLSVGGGNFVIKTNYSQLGLIGGLNLNHQTSLEGLATIAFQTYRYDSPQLNLVANVTGYPNLTPVGRYRIQGKIQLRWEVFSDFFWDLTFYDNYDSEPPEGAAKNDYNIVFSIVWSY
jgi:hypothetical protein